MSNKIEYGKVYDVNSDDEEIVNIHPMDVVDDNSNIEKTTIELSELPQKSQDSINYRLLNESVKRSTSPDELMFRSDISLKGSEYFKKMRDSKKETTYEIWRDLVEKGRKIDEDVIHMMQNYINTECHSDNLDNLERCRKYRELLDAYRERQQRIGGKRRRAKKYTMKSKRKSSKKSNKRRKGKKNTRTRR